jgi:outer membrane lipase/esterase
MTKVGMVRGALFAAVSGLALVAHGSAEAQQYNRIVSFGDSLTDNGNLFDATGNPPPPYNRRFTNQLVWSEYLFGSAARVSQLSAATLNGGNVNLAYGGARTDLAANSNGPIPSTGTQVGIFLGSGGRFGANDIASVWGGANNIFQALPVAAQNPATAVNVAGAAAVSSAADVGNQVRQLVAAGARTVLVYNLPDLGQTPQFANTAAQQLATVSSGTFNEALAQQMAAIQAANPGANIITVNAPALFSAIQANPGAFGLTNTTQQCIQVLSCVGGGAAAQNTFLFWDGVHPTATGHQIVAAAAAQYLTAPNNAAAASSALGETAFALRRSSALDALSTLGRMTIKPGQNEFFVNLTGNMGQANGTFQNGIGLSSGSSSGRAYEYASGGVRMGVARNLGNGFSVAGSLYAQTGNIDGKRARFEANATQLGADIVARYAPGNGFFVNAGLGLNVDAVSEFERRTIVALRNTGDANGTSFSAIAEAGYDVAIGGAVLTPVARLGYIRTDLGRFNESGAVAPVTYFGRSIEALLAGAELRAAIAIAPGIKATALIGYEGYVGARAGAVTGRLIANSAQPFSVSVRDPISTGLQFGLGAEATFGAWTAHATYRGSAGERSNVQHSLSLGAKFAF